MEKFKVVRVSDKGFGFLRALDADGNELPAAGRGRDTCFHASSLREGLVFGEDLIGTTVLADVISADKGPAARVVCPAEPIAAPATDDDDERRPTRKRANYEPDDRDDWR